MISPIASNLLSGIIGSLIGCAISYFIYRDSRIRDSKISLIQNLLFFKESIRNCNNQGGDIWRTFKNEYATTNGLFISYTSNLFPIEKNQMDEAWDAFSDLRVENGIETVNFPDDRYRAIERIEIFLRAVEKT